jgi:replication-associated recombination protein RarA
MNWFKWRGGKRGSMDTIRNDPNTPREVKDIVGNNDMWNDISTKIQTKTCPHTIICGPSGTGKSAFIRAAIMNRGLTFMSHNCIADSGLRDVRDAIRSFARGGIDGNGYHRWVILEHADSLTADTQAFLRRLLETASGSTRFIFEVRESGAISEPILSRCMLCNIEPPSYIEIRYEILRRTNHEIPIEQAERIAQESCGNVRIAVNQALASWRVGVSNVGCGLSTIEELWAKRPAPGTREYGVWACETIRALRKHGADPRAMLRMKMNSDTQALRILSQWNRPGGASGRSLWLAAMCGEKTQG